MKAKLISKFVTTAYNFHVTVEGLTLDVRILTDEKGKFQEESISLNGDELEGEGTDGDIREQVVNFLDKNWNTLVKS